jgi:hypothetical protein
LRVSWFLLRGSTAARATDTTFATFGTGCVFSSALPHVYSPSTDPDNTDSSVITDAVAPVPAPPVLALLALGLAMIALRRSRC